MREIRKGLQAGIDISNYAMLSMPYLKMRAIRKSAEDGLYFDDSEMARYNAGVLEQIHQAYLDKVDISEYVMRSSLNRFVFRLKKICLSISI